ncbi:MAG: AAA family ATPase [Anaerolineae bacterium]|nr:AAA family ATPase [Anaerolineae bacterium]
MSKRYLVGHPGTGKTTLLTDRLTELVNSGVRPDRILVLIPQESHARRFRAAFGRTRETVHASAEPKPRRARASAPEIHTFFGLAQRHVSLFFPRIAPRAGFANPRREPVWMNVEAAQYFLDRVAAPYVGDFEDLRMPHTRLLVQILDDLNRAATTGFALEELADRLMSAWHGAESRRHAYRAVQEIALAFRRFCLQHTLVDFSLGMELFRAHLLKAGFYREYVAARYRHVLADNVEEAAPVIHDFLCLLLETSDSAMIVEDDPGGFRINLGAEPQSARAVREACDWVEYVTDPRLLTDAPDSPSRFGQMLMQAIMEREGRAPLRSSAVEVLRSADGSPMRYWATMVQAAAERIGALIRSGVPAGEIAVVAPVVEDVLRFELEERLKDHSVGVYAVRPSRPLHDHPLVRALVTFARLAHLRWGQPASPQELTRALTLTISELDVVRAQIIADAVRRSTGSAGISTLPPLDDAVLWSRVGPQFCERYAALQGWLAQTAELEGHRAQGAPLDVFWQRFVGEVLSRPGFALHEDPDGALVCDKLIASARAFREVLEQSDLLPSALPTAELAVLGLGPRPDATETMDVGLAYITALTQNVLAAEYAPERSPEVPPDRVLLVPAYTYLTGDYRSRHQFWLDVNATSWHERFYQPLTHPYVLSRGWRPGTRWTDDDEQRVGRELLARVVGGLAFRCSDRIYLAAGELNVAGQEESGMLAQALRRLEIIG